MTSAGRPRRPRRDALENLDRILRAAREVFAAEGTEVSIEAVAARSGLGLGTIYRHFANKDALITDLARRLLTDAVELAETHAASGDPAALTGYLWDVSRLLAGQPGIIRRSWKFPGSDELTDRSRQAQARLVAQAQAAGLIRRDLSPEDVAVTLWAITGILDTARQLPRSGWERHLETVLAAWQPGTPPFTQPSLTPADIDAIIDGTAV
ncbi:TetR/AcrR family transcriptional regulator [Kutzneria sp. CA-103260]|uniref:TetR/AcrR family transcriptional regulator n=1 Tax=Kutzneria sp. CA-103260 TaxID=2802641 RepID=UPI001BA99E57|nr:TetR/AcrR family transcriptional regulator [Kutzneria sp. CA-103260]QUQ64146.1 Bacterial regulatory protein, tetR family [Kutzneria sp. CA-103260]